MFLIFYVASNMQPRLLKTWSILYRFIGLSELLNCTANDQIPFETYGEWVIQNCYRKYLPCNNVSLLMFHWADSHY
jgi:hypothetical protein